MKQKALGIQSSLVAMLTLAMMAASPPATVLAAPVIDVQPVSQTGRVAGIVTLSVKATGVNLTYQWYKGDTPLEDERNFEINGTVIGDVTGATSASVAISNLTAAAYGSDYKVKVTEGEVTFASNDVSITNTPAPSQGPFNALGGTSGAGVNNSAFIALTTGTVPAGATISASIGGVSTPVFAIPVGGTNPITSADNATLWVPTFAGNGFNVDLTWPGDGSTSIPVNDAPVGGSSITVTQDAPGSNAITVTALTPKFSGLVEPLVETPYVTAVYIFDANTGEVITPTRPGVSNTVSGSQLRMVDPLVLPSTALGKRIRAGFVIWYYQADYDELGSPRRYAALSDPFLMQTASGGGQDNGGVGSAPEPQPSASPTPTPEPTTPAAPTPTPVVVAPEIANPTAVTAQEIESFTPQQVALIPPSDFRQFPPAAIGALSPQQVAALTPAQVNSIRPARAAAITPTAASAMSPSQLEALRPASVRALPPQTLAALDGPQLAALRPDAVARITPQALRVLSPAQLRALTSEQRERLTPRQLRALSPLQRAALR